MQAPGQGAREIPYSGMPAGKNASKRGKGGRAGGVPVTKPVRSTHRLAMKTQTGASACAVSVRTMTCPLRAPLCTPCCHVTAPFTITASMPSAGCVGVS